MNKIITFISAFFLISCAAQKNAQGTKGIPLCFEAAIKTMSANPREGDASIYYPL